jgi:hypothetical protein
VSPRHRVASSRIALIAHVRPPEAYLPETVALSGEAIKALGLVVNIGDRVSQIQRFELPVICDMPHRLYDPQLLAPVSIVFEPLGTRTAAPGLVEYANSKVASSSERNDTNLVSA